MGTQAAERLIVSMGGKGGTGYTAFRAIPLHVQQNIICCLF